MRVLCRYVVKRGYRVSNWRVTPSARPRWPSVPDFLGQSRFLTTCSRKEISSPGMCICPVFGLMFRICPDLPISASVCLHISGEKLAQILSVYSKKNYWRKGFRPGLCWGNSRHSPKPPSRTPTTRLWRSHPMIIPDSDAQIMVTFSCHLNMGSDSISMKSDSELFQTRATATPKASSLILTWHIDWMSRCDVDLAKFCLCFHNPVARFIKKNLRTNLGKT